MNVLVRVFGQQVPVRSARVANFNIRNITRAAERLSASVLHRKNDDEVIDAIELAFDLLTVLKTDRRSYRSRVAAAAPTAGKPGILKLHGIHDAPADTAEVAGRVRQKTFKNDGRIETSTQKSRGLTK